jgi:hypothetical protein
MKKTKVKPLPGKNIFKRIMTKLLARNFLLFITIVLFVGMYIGIGHLQREKFWQYTSFL